MSYLVPIIDRVRLNEGSDKETYHIVLDLTHTDLSYSVGDCVAVYPENDPDLVEQIYSYFGKPNCSITYKEQKWDFLEFLQKRANLLKAPKKLGIGDHVLDVLKRGEPIAPQEFASLLLPLLPRFYSIASAEEAVGRQMHLTVSINENPPHFPTKFGTCSHYLCKRVPLHQPIQVELHKAKSFFLSPDSFQKPIIMVGPGTGIAPFRGFLQKRLQAGNRDNWLFFGERRKQYDFYYKEEWENAQGLTLDTAFSRDGEQKVYVQDRMLANSQKLWRWLEEGAYFYVCGDAKQMAKAVDQALKEIIESEGKVDSKEYIKNLKQQKRYLRDVY
ncbi:MAG: Sulfite reductase [NADPH] flavoprotein alpha-component [Chlamydiales bacterium]|nr:Sulfite reductase [NADPH] flavoprotein alpha-component [Chlamydiales bacterium]MCH9635658.1 Sulfite reductase [NADPH] flavoprotein alpha-component [Chlamydiales bacterium]MCH9703681.1 sulfite reductase [Chlamydiota bacterium]